jgi:hypothetical protein
VGGPPEAASAGKGPLPTLSVIVPTHNGGPALTEALAALRRSELKPLEVIVVDDGSTDDSLAGATEDERVIRLDQGPRGPSTARNRAAETARGEVLVFIDADVAVHPGTLGAIAGIMGREPGLDALFGSYDAAPPAPGLASRYKNLLHHLTHQRSGGDAHTFFTGCGAVRTATFRALGGFDEDLRWVEDIEFGMRLRSARGRIRLYPEVQVTHLKRWTLLSLWKTDIFGRALPWGRLLVSRGQRLDHLNVDRRSQGSAVAAWALVPAMALVPFWPTAGIVATAGALACFLWAQAPELGGLIRIGGIVFTVAALPLHWLYFLYSSAAFGYVTIEARVRSGSAAQNPSSTPRHAPNN